MSPIAHLAAAVAGGVCTGLLIAALPLWRLRRALATVRHLAHHDDTTALPNRRAFLAAVAATVRTGRTFGLIMLDLDGFKQVNDRHGHEAGNELLAEVGQRLADLPRPARLAARLSGDEFAILIDGGPDDTLRAAQLASAVIAHPPVMLRGGAAVAVRASVGYTTSRVGVGARILLCEADAAMYRAKRDCGGIRGYQSTAVADQPRPGRRRDRN